MGSGLETEMDNGDAARAFKIAATGCCDELGRGSGSAAFWRESVGATGRIGEVCEMDPYRLLWSKRLSNTSNGQLRSMVVWGAAKTTLVGYTVGVDGQLTRHGEVMS